jgi:hypothetical protein
VLLLALVASPGVGVAVYPRVPGQLVGARELLAAARELAGMRLLAGVGADVSSLVLQAVEGLVAERALVGARKLVGRLGSLGSWNGPIGLDDGNRSGRHGSAALVLAWCCRRWIKEIGKIHGRPSSLHVVERRSTRLSGQASVWAGDCYDADADAGCAIVLGGARWTGLLLYAQVYLIATAADVVLSFSHVSRCFLVVGKDDIKVQDSAMLCKWR